jgi:hypothetical protein
VSTPDVRAVVHAALSTVQGTVHHLGLVTLQVLTDRVAKAVDPLVTGLDKQAYDGELAMLRGLVRTLRVVVRPDEVDVGEVRRLLHEHDRDEASARDQAEATSAAQHFAAGHQEALDGHDPYRAQITGEDGRS